MMCAHDVPARVGAASITWHLGTERNEPTADALAPHASTRAFDAFVRGGLLPAEAVEQDGGVFQAVERVVDDDAHRERFAGVDREARRQPAGAAAVDVLLRSVG